MTGETEAPGRKTQSRATLYTTNPTLTGLKLDPRLRGKKCARLEVYHVFAKVPAYHTDSPRAGGSGDRIPVEAIFSALVRTSPRPTLTPIQLVPGLFPGSKESGAWCRG